jgi:hypothetical protein
LKIDVFEETPTRGATIWSVTHVATASSERAMPTASKRPWLIGMAKQGKMMGKSTPIV